MTWSCRLRMVPASREDERMDPDPRYLDLTLTFKANDSAAEGR